jgi:type III secretory pathway component EscT
MSKARGAEAFAVHRAARFLGSFFGRVFWARFARGRIAKTSSGFAIHDKARSGMAER